MKQLTQSVLVPVLVRSIVTSLTYAVRSGTLRASRRLDYWLGSIPFSATVLQLGFCVLSVLPKTPLLPDQHMHDHAPPIDGCMVDSIVQVFILFWTLFNQLATKESPSVGQIRAPYGVLLVTLSKARHSMVETIESSRPQSGAKSGTKLPMQSDSIKVMVYEARSRPPPECISRLYLTYLLPLTFAIC